MKKKKLEDLPELLERTLRLIDERTEWLKKEIRNILSGQYDHLLESEYLTESEYGEKIKEYVRKGKGQQRKEREVLAANAKLFKEKYSTLIGAVTSDHIPIRDITAHAIFRSMVREIGADDMMYTIKEPSIEDPRGDSRIRDYRKAFNHHNSEVSVLVNTNNGKVITTMFVGENSKETTRRDKVNKLIDLLSNEEQEWIYNEMKRKGVIFESVQEIDLYDIRKHCLSIMADEEDEEDAVTFSRVETAIDIYEACEYYINNRGD